MNRLLALTTILVLSNGCIRAPSVAPSTTEVVATERSLTIMLPAAHLANPGPHVEPAGTRRFEWRFGSGGAAGFFAILQVPDEMTDSASTLRSVQESAKLVQLAKLTRCNPVPSHALTCWDSIAGTRRLRGTRIEVVVTDSEVLRIVWSQKASHLIRMYATPHGEFFTDSVAIRYR